MYVLTFHDDIRIDEKHFKPFSERCVSSAAADLIQEVVSITSVCFFIMKHENVIALLPHSSIKVFGFSFA